MPSQKITFRNTDGENLAARLDLPLDKSPGAFALFAHCFTCSKNLKVVNNMSKALNREGIAVLRFDFTGLGESEGDFEDTNFTSNVEDLLSAAKYLEAEHHAPAILIGHSLGGAAVLMAAQNMPSVLAVATIGAPAEPSHVKKLLTGSEKKIKTEGEAEVSIGGRPFKVKKQFLDDLEKNKMQESVGNLKRALLILHSPLDSVVGINNAAEIFKAARHPKSFISLDQADHLLTKEKDGRYVGRVIASWAAQYIDTEARFPEKEELHENRILVRTGREGFRTEINANGHSLIADEPTSAGGTNTGPTPYDYLATALGACTTMTLRMYADRKKWPLEEVNVTLKHEKIHAEDCDDCESEKSKIDKIEREIELTGDLDKDQKQRLLEIADKCPVHKTLHSEIRVETGLKE